MASIADQFLQYGALRAQQSQNLGENIGNTIDMAMKIKMQRDADLAKKLEEEKKKQEELRKAALEPAAILAKANQFGVESLTPEERATFQAEQQIQGAKVVYDQFGQPRSGYNPIQLGATMAPSGIASTPLMPQAVGPTTVAQMPILPPTPSGVLLPPPAEGAAPKTQADFDKFMSGGELPAQEPTGTAAIVKTAEQRLADMGITKPVKPERLDFATAKQYEAELASYNEAKKQAVESVFAERKEKPKMALSAEKSFSSLMSDFSNISSKVDRAIQQSNSFNTGAMAGSVPTEGGMRATGRGVFGSGFLTGGVNLNETLKTIEADSAFSALQNMRDNSPTGGALGGIAVKELELLGAAKQSLSQSQNEEQLDRNLQEYKRIRQNAVKNVAEAYNQEFGQYPKGYNPSMFVDTSSIPQGAIDKLKSNPQLRDAFDAKYGAGAASKALGK